MRAPLPQAEFVCLAALMMSLVALSIDAMLPALPAIHADLALVDANDRQLVITTLFLGLGLGQLLYGPLSDATGRRPAIFLGFLLFIFGTVMCLWSTSFEWMLTGRFLQGMGAASPRIVMTAIIRDQFEGAAMARITSFIMAIFIFVPAVAPLLGQGVLLMGSWRLIFVVILLVGLLALAWFGWRQPETLPAGRRRSLRPGELVRGVGFILAQPQTRVGLAMSGLVFGSFVGYLSSAQQVFVDVYGMGQAFPLIFAALALAIGAASVVNARLVMRLGMIRLCVASAGAQTLISLTGLAAFVLSYGGHPPLWAFLLTCFPLFFVVGIQFGNLNAIAMQPLGALAGLGASVVGALSTAVAVPLGMVVGHAFNGSVVPLIAGFGVYGAISLSLLLVFLQRQVAQP